MLTAVSFPPLDIWLIMLAIRDTNKRLNKNTYLFFADLVKCFDRLWLKDCLVDLHEAGVREREIRILHKLNSEAHIIVKSPVGLTEEFQLGEMVKQGTIFGPKLCCVSTGKINNIGKRAKTVLSPNILIGAVTFVDDIGAIGSPDTVETVGKNCAVMEEEKGMEFSLPKTNWMCVKTGKEEKQEIKIVVKQGEIKEASEYKHVGNWWNSKGNFDSQINHMEKKANDMIRECNIFCSKDKLGKMEFEGKLFVFQFLIIASLFYNIEAWSNLRKSDKEHLEVIQGRVLKGIFGLPKSTPYWGILYELDLLPVNLLILYRKLMVYHMLVNSDDSRVARKVILEQEEMGHDLCWFSNLKEEAGEIAININRKMVENKSKSWWKTTVKKAVLAEYEKQMCEKLSSMKKLRFLRTKARDTYLLDCGSSFREAMIIRLNMAEIVSSNFGIRGSICSLCGEADSTEHVLLCSKILEHRVNVEDLFTGNNMDTIAKRFALMEETRRDEMIKTDQCY